MTISYLCDWDEGVEGGGGGFGENLDRLGWKGHDRKTGCAGAGTRK